MIFEEERLILLELADELITSFWLTWWWWRRRSFFFFFF